MGDKIVKILHHRHFWWLLRSGILNVKPDFWTTKANNKQHFHLIWLLQSDLVPIIENFDNLKFRRSWLLFYLEIHDLLIVEFSEGDATGHENGGGLRDPEHLPPDALEEGRQLSLENQQLGLVLW